MDRKFLLAILLSFLVLYLWSGLVRPPEKSLPENTQHVVRDEVTKTQESSTPLPSSAFEAGSSSGPQQVIQGDQAAQTVQVSEDIKIIETKYLRIEFSNIGGTIKSISLKKYDTSLPVNGMGDISILKTAEFQIEKYTNEEISYSHETVDYKVTKSYRLSPDEYIVQLDVNVVYKNEMSKQNPIWSNAINLDMSSLDNKSKDRQAARDRSLNEYVISSQGGIARKNNAYKFADKEKKVLSGPINWIGFRNRYYCVILKPLYDIKECFVDPVSDNNLKINVKPAKIDESTKNEQNFSYILFAGPESLNLLKKYNYGFENIRRYYKWTLFDSIAKLIYFIMDLLNKFIPNWGICIILISFIIYFSMYPLTMRSMSSMRKMQALQPKIATLKEKHKNNPQRMNKEMMELYKEEKVNPFGGCLPMFLQMPVFIGLYQVLWRSVSLKGADFLWIKDLSAPDRLLILPYSLPVIGNELNILPIIMMVVMFFQQKLTSRNMTITDPNQLAQQRMMSTIFPLFLGFIFYKFSSGLTLYFTMFYLLSTFTQWKIGKKTKAA